MIFALFTWKSPLLGCGCRQSVRKKGEIGAAKSHEIREKLPRRIPAPAAVEEHSRIRDSVASAIVKGSEATPSGRPLFMDCVVFLQDSPHARSSLTQMRVQRKAAPRLTIYLGSTPCKASNTSKGCAANATRPV